MAPTEADSNWILAIPFAIVGLSLLGAGALLLYRGVRLQINGRIVEGEVVRRVPHHVPVALQRAPNPGGPGFGSTATIYFAYRAEDGQTKTARLGHQMAQRHRSKGYKLNLPLGARTKLLIDPADPEVAFLAHSIGQRLVFPGLMLGAGVLTTLIALGVAFG